ncbi:MAG: hypothetical protein ABIA93_01435 [Candidatus Woesearchaeota archaeon]
MARDSRAFNRDMGSYIRTRRRRDISNQFKAGPVQVDEPKREGQGFLSLIGMGQRKEAVIREDPDDLTPEEKTKFASMKSSGFSRTPAEDEEIDDMYRKMPRIGFFDKLGEMFRTKDEEIPVVEIPQQEVDEDLKVLLKQMLVWLDQLSPAKKRMFKASEDFKLYKKVLEKYELVKK